MLHFSKAFFQKISTVNQFFAKLLHCEVLTAAQMWADASFRPSPVSPKLSEALTFSVAVNMIAQSLNTSATEDTIQKSWVVYDRQLIKAFHCIESTGHPERDAAECAELCAGWHPIIRQNDAQHDIKRIEPAQHNILPKMP